MKDTHNPKSKQTGETAEGSPPSKQDSKDESDLLANPPKSLDRIAKTVSEAQFRNAGLESTVEIAPSLKPDKSNPGVGDPFDPRSWERAGASGALQSADGGNGASEKGKASADKTLEQSGAAPGPARDLVRDIASQLGKAPQDVSREVEVKATDKGLLISLTETADFEMFRSGSAEPEPQMLALVQAVAEALKSRPGQIVIRGHTDSRPYRRRYYDNWQLSTARANLARYMLIRGGLDEGRIERIEGVADKEPRNAADPQAPENRRIEIFIAEHKP